ncbi:uncharacterized protein LOC121062789 [Cygnus olor]|uniref:uncharacterized protein LOC121062789 n=1 Tax=Cygnus olor TaxID=8869 RepID=UPI001ADEA231|nr:uncharacterized protein LOC121062789 [Cygnus olor]
MSRAPLRRRQGGLVRVFGAFLCMFLGRLASEGGAKGFLPITSAPAPGHPPRKYPSDERGWEMLGLGLFFFFPSCFWCSPPFPPLGSAPQLWAGQGLKAQGAGLPNEAANKLRANEETRASSLSTKRDEERAGNSLPRRGTNAPWLAAGWDSQRSRCSGAPRAHLPSWRPNSPQGRVPTRRPIDSCPRRLSPATSRGKRGRGAAGRGARRSPSPDAAAPHAQTPLRTLAAVRQDPAPGQESRRDRVHDLGAHHDRVRDLGGRHDRVHGLGAHHDRVRDLGARRDRLHGWGKPTWLGRASRREEFPNFCGL